MSNDNKNSVDEYITLTQAGKHSRILLSDLHKRGGVWLNESVFAYYALEVPSVRHQIANKNGHLKRWHVFSAGGLGDQICAVPTVDYIHDVLKAEEIVVSCHYPEIYYGRDYVKAIKINSPEYLALDWSKYFTAETLVFHTRPHSDWLSLHMINCMDVTPLVALGRTLPNKYRRVKLYIPDDIVSPPEAHRLNRIDGVVLHPGLTWPSRTIPASWWNDVILRLKHQGKTPIIIGARCPNGNSTVDGLQVDGCIDFRNKLTFHETLNVMSLFRDMITNDSAPYHMACSLAMVNRVFVLATGRPFDYIRHANSNAINIALGCKLDAIDLNTRSNNVNIYSHCTPEEMQQWLPDPIEFVDKYFTS